MIQVTTRAAKGLERILTANQVPDNQGIKLVPANTGGIGMSIGSPGDSDVVFEGDRSPLLIVDAAIARQFEGAVVDLTKSDGDEPQFVIRRDGAASP